MPLPPALLAYSETLGRDPLLVQGAGGNLSWKDGDTLWIKASGTWLAEARAKEIFVPMRLGQTRALLAAGEADLMPAVHAGASLRPSIETSLHTMLPHAIVAHVHAVEVLALSVLKDGQARLEERLRGLRWLWVDYTKPGAPLAAAIAAAMEGRAAPDVLVLGNHGLIVAGETLAEVQARLEDVVSRCRQTPRALSSATALEGLAEAYPGYRLLEDMELHALALDPTCLALARAHWVMYPDHAVFLGAQASFSAEGDPVCVLAEGRGVLVREDINPGQSAMLRCYLDVAARLPGAEYVQSLSMDQIAELLNWDAEKYRQSLNARPAS